VAIKVLAVLFAVLALRRVIARYRRTGTVTLELVVWASVFSGIGLVVFIPHKTDAVAQWLGVSSGFNALTFIAICGLLFATYRLILRVHALERDVTRIVRSDALANPIFVKRKDDASATEVESGTRPMSSESPDRR
jgi:hypothetical protein